MGAKQMNTGEAKVGRLSCEEVWREISNYLDEEITGDLAARMEEHFKGCKRCAAILDGTRNIMRLVGQDALLDLPAGFSDRLEQKLNRGPFEGYQRRERRMNPPINDSYDTNAATAELKKTYHIENADRPQFPNSPYLSDPADQSRNRIFSAIRRDRKTRAQQTVFYVDDNPKALKMLTFALKGSGYRVETACNAREALERMEQSRFDLVLLAHRAPKMIDPELAREITRFSPGTPIILILNHTALAAEELMYVDAYVDTCATLDSLLTKIRALIGRR
jgi:CheY-like chemotaxis protein